MPGKACKRGEQQKSKLTQTEGVCKRTKTHTRVEAQKTCMESRREGKSTSKTESMSERKSMQERGKV